MEYIIEENLQPNLPKIKIFQAIQKNLLTIGIGRNSAMQLRQFNLNILMDFLTLGCGIICMLMHIFTEVRTFIELTQSIYMFSSFTLLSVALMILIFNLDEWFSTINDCECLVNISKSKSNIAFQKPKPKALFIF